MSLSSPYSSCLIYRWDENIKIKYTINVNSYSVQEQYIDIMHKIGDAAEGSADYDCIADSINEIILHSADAHKVKINHNIIKKSS